MIFDILKKENTSKRLIMVFISSFILQIIRYQLNDYNFTHIVLLALQSLFIGVYIVFPTEKKYKSKKIINIIFVYFLSVILTFISRQYLGFLVSNNINSLITDITSLFIIILYYNVIVSAPLNHIEVKKLLSSYLYLALFFIVYAFIFQFDEIVKALTASHAYASSFSSFFTNRNSYGFFLYSFYSVFLIQSKFYRDKLGKIKYLIIYVVVLLSMLLTLSRTSMIGTALLTLIIFIDYLLRKIKIDRHKITSLIISLIFFLVFSIVIISFLSNENVLQFIINKVVRSEYKTTGRVDLWKIGFDNLKLNPIFGIGSFGSRGMTSNTVFHNTIIEIIVRNGILGLILKCFIFYSFLKYHLQNNFTNNEQIKFLKYYFISLVFVMQFETILFFKIGIRQILLLYIIFILNSKIINIPEEDE